MPVGARQYIKLGMPVCWVRVVIVKGMPNLFQCPKVGLTQKNNRVAAPIQRRFLVLEYSVR